MRPEGYPLSIGSTAPPRSDTILLLRRVGRQQSPDDGEQCTAVLRVEPTKDCGDACMSFLFQRSIPSFSCVREPNDDDATIGFVPRALDKPTVLEAVHDAGACRDRRSQALGQHSVRERTVAAEPEHRVELLRSELRVSAADAGDWIAERVSTSKLRQQTQQLVDVRLQLVIARHRGTLGARAHRGQMHG